MKNIKNILLQYSSCESTGVIYSYSNNDFEEDQYMEILLLPEEDLEQQTLRLIQLIIKTRLVKSLTVLFMVWDVEKEDKLQRLLESIEKERIVDSLHLKQLSTIDRTILRISDLIYYPIDTSLCGNEEILTLHLENTYKSVVFDQFKVQNSLLRNIHTRDLSFIVYNQESIRSVLLNRSIEILSFYIDLLSEFTINTINESVYDLYIHSPNDFHLYRQLLANFYSLDYLNYTKIYDGQ